MHAALAESDVVELIMTDYNYGWVYYDYSGDWYCSVMCTADNGDQYDLNIDFYSESLYGEFGFETLDPYYTYCRKNNVEFSVVDGHLTVTPGAEEGKADLDATFVTSMGETLELDHGQIQVAASTDNVITVDAQLVFENAVSYSFHVQKELEVAGHKTVEAHNMEQTDLFGLIYYLIGSNDEYSRIQASMMASPFPGDWTDYIVFVLDADTYEVSSSIVKSAIITEDTNGKLVLDAQFLGDDFVDYTLHMDLYVPDVTDQATFVSHSAELNDLTDYYGAFQITALSDDVNDYLSIVLDDWYIHSASYNALSSANKSYCYVILNLGGEDQQILPMYSCDVNFIVDGNTFSLTGECQAGNTIYDIDLSGVIPEEEPRDDAYDDPDNDVDTEFTLDEISLFEYRADYGYYLIQLANVEGECFYSLIYTDSEELQAGVYPISTEYAPGTVQAGSVSGTSAYPTFYAHLNDAGQITPPLWLCVGGTVTIGYDATGDISLLVEAVNTWGRTARIMVNGDPTGIHSVEAQQPNANGKRFENRQILIHTNGQDYNAFGQKLQR